MRLRFWRRRSDGPPSREDVRRDLKQLDQENRKLANYDANPNSGFNTPQQPPYLPGNY